MFGFLKKKDDDMSIEVKTPFIHVFIKNITKPSKVAVDFSLKAITLTIGAVVFIGTVMLSSKEKDT